MSYQVEYSKAAIRDLDRVWAEVYKASKDIEITERYIEELLDKVEKKTLAYLDTLTDEMLYEKPENCPFTRMELVLRQYRHLSFHTGMLNGQTAVATGQFPMWVSETDKYVDDGILFGRYRKVQVPG